MRVFSFCGERTASERMTLPSMSTADGENEGEDSEDEDGVRDGSLSTSSALIFSYVSSNASWLKEGSAGSLYARSLGALIYPGRPQRNPATRRTGERVADHTVMKVCSLGEAGSSRTAVAGCTSSPPRLASKMRFVSSHRVQSIPPGHHHVALVS